MGLFSSSPSLPEPKISSDGAPIAPDRTQRAKCWEARDAYFKCLDRNNIIDSISEKDKAEKGCSAEARGFESNCASSWVCLEEFIVSMSQCINDWNEANDFSGQIGNIFQEAPSDGISEEPDTRETEG